MQNHTVPITILFYTVVFEHYNVRFYKKNPISYYRVDIQKLAKEAKGFNHASCQCSYPAVEVDQFSFLDCTYLSHIHLAVAQNTDHVFVLATYGGIAAL
jgi:hypothetical protein